MSVLQVYKLSETAKLPTRAHSDDAGLDLCSNENVVVPSRKRKMIGTGISVIVPKGCYGHVVARSGLATKYCIDIGAGVIDANYRGEVKVCFINNAEEDFEVTHGMRIAQLLCPVIQQPSVVCVSNMDKTDRGTCGFGSSGL